MISEIVSVTGWVLVIGAAISFPIPLSTAAARRDLAPWYLLIPLVALQIWQANQPRNPAGFHWLILIDGVLCLGVVEIGRCRYRRRSQAANIRSKRREED